MISLISSRFEKVNILQIPIRYLLQRDYAIKVNYFGESCKKMINLKRDEIFGISNRLNNIHRTGVGSGNVKKQNLHENNREHKLKRTQGYFMNRM